MANLSFADRRTLEQAFGMGSGYVLDFSNRTFADFIQDSTGRDIYDGRYSVNGTSKANHLRSFWQLESDAVVGRLLEALVEHGLAIQAVDQREADAVRRIIERLQGEELVPDLDAITPNADEPTFNILAKAVRHSIDSGRPEEALDRLHTFLTKYLRVLCAKDEIPAPREKPLHSLAGEYIKRLRAEGVIRSAMTERIAKSSLSTLEAFNQVRNEQSLAHDNPVLESHEAIYILNHVASLVRLLQTVEQLRSASRETAVMVEDDDLPF